MTTYRIDLYAEPHRLTGVHLVSTRIGREAIHEAHKDIKESGCDFAEVYMSDGCGGTVYYTRVHNEITEEGNGFRLYTDDLARMFLDAVYSPPPPPGESDDREMRERLRMTCVARINGTEVPS